MGSRREPPAERRRRPDLVAGRVGRPHGLDGAFHVTRANAALLPLGGPVIVAGRVRSILRRAGTDDRPILRVEGVEDRAGAEALRGEDLLVARTAAPALEAGEYWAEDLVGCAVVALDGRSLGTVGGLRALPSCEALEVGELLVPMVKDAVRDVDVGARRIVVDADFLGLEGPPEVARAAPRRPGAAPVSSSPVASSCVASSARVASSSSPSPARPPTPPPSPAPPMSSRRA